MPAVICLALLAEAAQQLPEDYPSLRLANPMQVQNHASVDLYVDEVLRHAKVILISLHGGIGYWRYGIERLVLELRPEPVEQQAEALA